MPSPSRAKRIRCTLARRTAAVLLGTATPVAGWAVCSCGFGDGQFTQTTIALDGNMTDWAAVHADVDNNVCDAVSGDPAERDGTIQSTGRDLTHFAYTWDSTNVYLFTQRAGSSTNTQTFVYYADIDNDGLMETGEPVIGVTWQASNRQINVYIFDYVAAAAGGDPMVDADGYGDGYTMPGSFANVPGGGNPTRSGAWGSGDGVQMEFYVTWAELGLAPNTPFTFHVSSTNASLNANNFAAQVDDNLSGCGGRLGSTVVPGVEFTTDVALVGFESQTVIAAHTLTNTGNDDDRYDLSSLVSGDFTPGISYYEDADGSGTLTAGDVPLTDGDGDGSPDTRTLAPGESISVLIAYDVPAGVANNDVASVTTTAASDYEPDASDAVTDTITVLLPPELLVTKSVSTVADPVNGGSNPKAIPGSEMLYTVDVVNQGAGTVDSDALVITDGVPGNGCLRVTDIDGPGTGPVRFTDGSPASGLSYTFTSLASATDDLAFSDDGGASFAYTPAPNAAGCDPAVTHVRMNPKGAFAAAAGAGAPSAEFSFLFIVN